MAWAGKAFFGGLGWIIGGPLGGIIGAAFGNSIDEDSDYGSVQQSNALQQANEQERLRGQFILSMLTLCSKMAKADGLVTKDEIAAMERILNDIGFDKDGKREAFRIWDDVRKSDNTFTDYANEFYAVFAHNRDALFSMFNMIFSIAAADKVLAPKEEKLLRKAIKIFNLTDEDYKNVKAKYFEDSTKYYEILGCKVEDSDEQIKKQYRKLAMEYHPDAISSKQLPEGFIKFAESKFNEINTAYEAIKKERNI
jgi:DnaJ like chaperone protein